MKYKILKLNNLLILKNNIIKKIFDYKFLLTFIK